MLHYASRLRVPQTATIVPITHLAASSSLTDILQLAAGRAWVRRVNTNINNNQRHAEPSAPSRVGAGLSSYVL